ncbi:MAG TPA: PHP domain-containing protein [bacterium]|nr:PHP domain-containing protein [bacterium]
MKADLHMHSRYSDGGHWPDELVGMAATSGLQAVCLTDHDTLGGYPEFADAAASAGLTTWPAVEIDCIDESIGYRSEILAYFPDGTYAATEALLRAGRAERVRTISSLFERARALFSAPEMDFGSLVSRRQAGRSPEGPAVDGTALRYAKTDFFLALIDAGVIPANTRYWEFKQAYFNTGLFSDVRFSKPELADVVELIVSDGGIPVLPHVGHEFGDSIKSMRSRAEHLDAILDRCRDLGVLGIELYDYRTDDTKAINALVARQSRRYGFFNTYGSDFHGPGSNKTLFGSFHGDFKGFPRRKARRKG